ALSEPRGQLGLLSSGKHYPNLPEVVGLVHCGCNCFIVICTSPNHSVHGPLECRLDLCFLRKVLRTFRTDVHRICTDPHVRSLPHRAETAVGAPLTAPSQPVTFRGRSRKALAVVNARPRGCYFQR